ncbi:MAG: DUF192 domain-containing protein [Candidatus Paceibacterota bacterium]|jgi:hypothetical protein
MKNSIKISIIIAILTIFIFSLVFVSRDDDSINVKTTKISAPSGEIQVEIADTPSSMQLGLSNRETLASNHGMLFAYTQPNTPGFWMNDMNFPLDMIWIDEDMKVVGITSNIPVDSFPNSFYPPSPIKFVLELNAGTAAKMSLATGTQLIFDNF